MNEPDWSDLILLMLSPVAFGFLPKWMGIPVALACAYPWYLCWRSSS